MVNLARARELAEAGLEALRMAENAQRESLPIGDRLRQARHAFEGATNALRPSGAREFADA